MLPRYDRPHVVAWLVKQQLVKASRLQQLLLDTAARGHVELARVLLDAGAPILGRDEVRLWKGKRKKKKKKRNGKGKEKRKKRAFLQHLSVSFFSL